jgi:hypothetical protein
MPAPWATWRPGKLTGKQAACLATGKALPQRGNLERELKSCWGSSQRGSKWEWGVHKHWSADSQYDFYILYENKESTIYLSDVLTFSIPAYI